MWLVSFVIWILQKMIDGVIWIFDTFPFTERVCNWIYVTISQWFEDPI